MNNARRKRIQDVINELCKQQTRLEDIRDEEQEAFDNLPEGLQCSERGEAMEEAISELDDVITTLEGLAEDLENIIGE